jgi:hypothetical protein
MRCVKTCDCPQKRKHATPHSAPEVQFNAVHGTQVSPTYNKRNMQEEERTPVRGKSRNGFCQGGRSTLGVTALEA